MTSTTAAPPSPLPGWLKKAAVTVLIFALCWAVAITYWRGAENAPAGAELLLALLVAPLGLLSLLWLGKKIVTARAVAPAATGSASVAQTAAAAPPVAPLAILAAALRVPHGASPEDLAAAMAANGARPDLDPELVDDDGFPVMSARSEEAVDEALQEEVQEWLMLNGMAELRLGEAGWRALTLGSAVVRDLAQEAMLQLMPEQGTPPPLRLLPILPTGWTVEQRHAAGLWFKHVIAQRGWPMDSLTRMEVAFDATPAAILGQCAADCQAPNKAATLLLACDSQIDQDTVDTWAANGSLCTATRAGGRIPGEGAAGLLLSSVESARQHPDALFACLYPLQEGRREVSSDSAKRPDTKHLSDLAERCAQGAGLALASVALIAADSDHRASRAQEVMGLASASFPELDASTDVLRTGATTGSCGAVPFIGALALARHAVFTNAAPTLFLSNDDPFMYSMALIGPPPAQSA